MERQRQIPLEERIKAHAPTILQEMRDSGLEEGAKVDQVKAVVPILRKPDVVEEIFGKSVSRTNGHVFLSREDIVYALVHRDFGHELRTPQMKKRAHKIARRLIEG